MTATGRRCPACGGSSGSLVHRLRLRTPEGHPLQGGYDVVACERCGCGFADAPVAQAFYDRYFLPHIEQDRG